MDEFTEKDYWRMIILYGMNASTYKLALGKCLFDFTQEGKSHVTMKDLSKKFFDSYEERLKKGLPLLGNERRSTKIEQIVTRFDGGTISYDQAIELTEQNAFGDVIPRFHTLNGAPLLEGMLIWIHL